MSELPRGWVEAPLGALSQFVMGQAPPGSASNFDNIGTPFVKAGEFGVERPIIREWTTQPLKTAEEGDVLICVVGATSGKINLGANCAIGRSVAAIRPSSGLDQFYLYGFMKTKVDELRRGSTGTAQGVISSVMLAEIGIPLAPVPEQRRIVAKVDGLTARTARARADLSRIPTLIARYKQRLLALAFSGELTAGWRRANDLDDFELVKLASLCRTLTDGDHQAPPRSDSGVPFITISAMNTGRIDLTKTTRTVPQSYFDGLKEARRPAIGDVLFSVTGSVGIPALVETDLPFVFQRHIAIMKPDKGRAGGRYLSYLLAAPQIREQVDAVATGTAQLTVPLGGLRNFDISRPTVGEQAEIVRRIESAFGWLDRVAADHAAAARLIPKLDAAILSKAFRGDLVPQDPNDEPASVLLDRIKAERATEGARPKKARGRPKGITVESHIGPMRAEVIRPKPKPKGAAMAKTRQDDDVKGKPYLAGLLKSAGRADVQSLFRAADLPVADFYKQLAWEIDAKHIIDNPDELRAA